MAALRPISQVSGGLLRAARSIRRWQLWCLPPWARRYVLGIDALAVCAIAVAVAHTRTRGSDLLLGGALLTCGIVAIESTRTVKEAHGEVVRDLQSVWLLAIAIALPPVFAFLAPFPLMAYKLLRVPRLVIYRRLFSNATLSLAYGSASQVFHTIPRSIAGPVPGSGQHALTWTASVAVWGLLGWIVNYGLLVVAFKLAD